MTPRGWNLASNGLQQAQYPCLSVEHKSVAVNTKDLARKPKETREETKQIRPAKMQAVWHGIHSQRHSQNMPQNAQPNSELDSPMQWAQSRPQKTAKSPSERKTCTLITKDDNAKSIGKVLQQVGNTTPHIRSGAVSPDAVISLSNSKIFNKVKIGSTSRCWRPLSPKPVNTRGKNRNQKHDPKVLSLTLNFPTHPCGKKLLPSL